MSVRFFYVDESHDERHFCLSAIAIRHSDWKECFDAVRDHRQQLKRDHGVFLRREIHARELVKGKGRISDHDLGKWQRTRIFYGLLTLVAKLPNVMVFNICLPTSGLRDPQMKAWDRITNRIERTMRWLEETELQKREDWSTLLSGMASMADKRGQITAADAGKVATRLNAYRARAFIIADEGRENEIVRALRRMHIHNLIPSQFREWAPGVTAMNIPTERIIEDPVFKKSSRSYFLQLADCVAFALLKRESAPTPHVAKYGIHKMFDDTIKQVCFLKASSKDPCGIVRR